ncbi:hypothetical protein SDC9_80304 [bioreactor metagenome]|uniref:Uncharacterized protein n=1 Tax=bioreactor metagenome TaxID=1076179 RepID=A0A644YYV2_9ZZZZ
MRTNVCVRNFTTIPAPVRQTARNPAERKGGAFGWTAEFCTRTSIVFTPRWRVSSTLPSGRTPWPLRAIRKRGTALSSPKTSWPSALGSKPAKRSGRPNRNARCWLPSSRTLRRIKSSPRSGAPSTANTPIRWKPSGWTKTGSTFPPAPKPWRMRAALRT